METLTKITVQTSVLQDLVSRAVKASSFKPQLPLTCLMHLEIKNKKLQITTTDDVNTMTVFTNVDANDLNVVVDSKLFHALVSKITTEKISLTTKEGLLVMEGNGVYELKNITEADGSKIEFPVIEDFEITNSNHVTKDSIKSILTMNKSCKSDQMIMPAIYNYYVNDKRVMTTDSYIACDNPIKLVNEPLSITPSMMDLVPLVSEDSGVDVTVTSEYVMFYSSIGKLISKRVSQADVDSFPINELLESFNEALPYECKINRTLLLNAVDRLCLFTDAYNSYKITLTFNNKEVKIQTDKSNCWEKLLYLNEVNDSQIGEFSIDVDATFLKNELISCNSEELKVKFGGDNGVQLQCDSVNLLLSVLGDGE